MGVAFSGDFLGVVKDFFGVGDFPGNGSADLDSTCTGSCDPLFTGSGVASVIVISGMGEAAGVTTFSTGFKSADPFGGASADPLGGASAAIVTGLF